MCRKEHKKVWNRNANAQESGKKCNIILNEDLEIEYDRKLDQNPKELLDIDVKIKQGDFKIYYSKKKEKKSNNRKKKQSDKVWK